MDFIQCKDEDDAETQMKTTKAAFVSSDHRVYEDIEFWDDTGVYSLNAKTLLSLYELQSTIEQLTDGERELFMGNLKDTAKEIDDAFNKAVKAIGYKPIRKQPRYV